MIVIGDVHGELQQLESLISRFPSGSPLCFVGDVVDRGRHSRECLELIRSRGYHMVMGNHEQMMVDSLLPLIDPPLVPPGDSQVMDTYYTRRDWLKYGGTVTLASYGIPVDSAWSAVTGAYELPPQLVEDILWLRGLPYYREFPEYRKSGRHLVVSHSGIHGCWDRRDTPLGRSCALWDREASFTPGLPEGAGIYNVFGHTPLREPFIRERFACIDTGAFDSAGGGYLTALEYPSGRCWSTR